MHSVRLLLVIATMSLSCRAIGQWLDISADSTFFNNQIHFINPNVGFVVGYDGIYQSTIDGGNTWDTSNVQFDADWSMCNCSPAASDLASIHFANDTIGYIGGSDGDIFKTSDGGITWRWYSRLGSWDDVESLCFVNSDTGYARTWSAVWHTYDGGLTWSYVALQGKADLEPVDSANVLLSGNGIFRSSDYGVTWTRMNADSTVYFRNISMSSSQKGAAVTANGKISLTSDGGYNWTTPNTISSMQCTDVEMINDSCGFVATGTNWSNNWQNNNVGAIIYTLDGGLTWSMPDTVGTKTMLDLEFPLDSLGFACGWLGNVLKTVHPVIAQTTSDVDEFGTKLDPTIFPNPSIGSEIYVFIGELPTCTLVEISIVDAFGRCVHVEETQKIAPYRIDVSTLQCGVYFLHCLVNGISYTTKFIIAHE